MNKQEYMGNLIEALRDFDEEIRNEIIGDYEEHFEIGLSNGKTEEQIIEELGSIEELVKELKDLQSEKKADRKVFGQDGFNFNSEDVANVINDMAKGFAGFLGSVAATFSKGAEKVTESVSDGAGSFVDTVASGFETVGDKVAQKTSAFAKEVAESYKAARAENDSCEEKVDAVTEGDESKPSSECDSIVVKTDCGNIVAHDSATGELKVNYENYGTPNQKLAYRFESFQKGKTFYVYVKKQPGTTNFFRALSNPKIVIDVALPENMKSIELDTASGSVDCEGVSSKEIKIYDLSGSIDLKNSGFEDVTIKNVSGLVDITGVNAEDINVKAVSGKVNVEANAKTCKVNNTSGTVRVYGPAFEKVKVATVSGSVSIEVDGCPGFTADTSSVSGSVCMTHGESFIKGAKSGRQVLGDGSVSIEASTISGSININA